MIIEELAVPTEVTDDWSEMVRVRNEIEADAVGNYDLAYEPSELLPPWQNPHEPKRLFVARVDGRIVARAIYEIEDESNPTAWVSVEVLSAFRNRGIGSALFDTLLELARSEKRTALQSYVPQKISPDTDVIPSPTGFGSVPRNSASTRFLLKRGFALEQVERMSRLELPVERIDELLQQATDATGPDYTLSYVAGPTPAGFHADVSLLRTRMATDAPSAGLDVAAEPWTSQRVADEEQLLLTSPRTRLTVFAHHTDGRIAGFNELSVPLEVSRPVSQEDTIVLAEHRGHRLGMLLKVANIAHLQRVSPGHPSITTFNAEENRFMLSVNEAVGFVPWGYEGAWRAEV